MYAIKPGIPIGFSISDDRELCTVKIFDNYAAGKITGMEDGKKLYIDDVPYELSKYYMDNINTFTLGTKAMCYLSDDGKIIFIDEIIEDAMSYAFIVDVKKLSGMEETVHIKMFTQSGDMLISPLKEKLTYNGEAKKASDVYTLLRQLIDSGLYLTGDDLKRHDGKRVVKYLSDSEGEITKLALAEEITDISEISQSRGAYDRPFIYSSAETYHRYGIFSPYFVSGSATLFIKVPLTGAERQNDESYEIVDSSFFVNGQKYFLTAYDVSRGGFAPVVLVSSDDNSMDEETSSAVVERVFETINNDGMVCYAAQLYINDSYGVYYETDATSATVRSLGPGDIIRATVNKDNELKNVLLDFDYSTKTVTSSVAETDPLRSKTVEYLIGSVYSLEGENVILVPLGTDMSASLVPSDAKSTTAAISKTVFVKMIKSRDGAIQGAEVYKEKSTDAVNSYLKVGTDADFIVSRTRYKVPSLTCVYTD